MNIKDALSAYSEYLDGERLINKYPVLTREQMVAALVGSNIAHRGGLVHIGSDLAGFIVDLIIAAAGPEDKRTHDDLVKDFVAQTNEGSPLRRYLESVDSITTANILPGSIESSRLNITAPPRSTRDMPGMPYDQQMSRIKDSL